MLQKWMPPNSGMELLPNSAPWANAPAVRLPQAPRIGAAVTWVWMVLSRGCAKLMIYTAHARDAALNTSGACTRSRSADRLGSATSNSLERFTATRRIPSGQMQSVW